MQAGELRRRLVADSIERKHWMDRLIQLTREEERNRVLATLERAREQREASK